MDKGSVNDVVFNDLRKKDHRSNQHWSGLRQSRIVIKFDNHVTSQHGGHFKSREFSYSPSLSEILSDLIRCKLVGYPWFCSARPRSFTCFKTADVYHAYWSKFPSQSEVSIRFLFRAVSGMFFHFVVKYIHTYIHFIFLLLCTISEKSASGIFILNALSIMSAIFDWCLPQGAEMADEAHRSKSSKLCRLCGKIASSKTSRPRNRYDSSCYTTPHFSNAKFIYTWNMHYNFTPI